MKSRNPVVIGNTYGHLMVIAKITGADPNKNYQCKCICGSTVYSSASALNSGRKKSCGCKTLEMRSQKLQERCKFNPAVSEASDDGVILGNFYNYLMPLRVLNVHPLGNSYSARCICGSRVDKVAASSLLSGNRKSCGCLQFKGIGKGNTVHGLANHPLYSKWRGMMDRCYNKNAESYKNYGGRGILVDERWRSAENFINDMEGADFVGLDIDRRDNNKGYSLDNCRFVTTKVNSNNRRSNRMLTHDGKTMTVTAWSEYLGVSAPTLFGRLYRGWDVERTLTTTIRRSAAHV